MTATTPQRNDAHKQEPSQRAHLVLVAGLYSPAWVMRPMAKRLRRRGYTVSVFSRFHPTQTARVSAEQLREYLNTLPDTEVHLVAHSFGGIVLLHLFEQQEEFPSLRSVLLLASPVLGSDLATHLSQGRLRLFWRFTLGKSLEHGLLGDAPAWNIPTPVGYITARSESILARLIRRDAEPGDGLVQFTETHAEGGPVGSVATLDTTHAGLLFSESCCSLIDEFVRNGRFPG